MKIWLLMINESEIPFIIRNLSHYNAILEVFNVFYNIASNLLYWGSWEFNIGVHLNETSTIGINIVIFWRMLGRSNEPNPVWSEKFLTEIMKEVLYW